MKHEIKRQTILCFKYDVVLTVINAVSAIIGFQLSLFTVKLQRKLEKHNILKYYAKQTLSKIEENNGDLEICQTAFDAYYALKASVQQQYQ